MKRASYLVLGAIKIIDWTHLQADTRLSVYPAMMLINWRGGSMKITGFLLMPAGWFLGLAALVLLRTVVARDLFIAAGIGVEFLGLGLFTRAHWAAKGGNE